MRILLAALLLIPSLSFADGVYTRSKLGSGSGSGGSATAGGTVTGANQYRTAGGTLGGDDLVLDDGTGLMTFRGAQLLISSTNTFLGTNAGNAGGTATNGANTAFGSQALMGLTGGSSNTMVGRLAGMSIGNGLRNTAVGSGALLTNTGSDNIAIGVNAGGSVTTATGMIAIGNSSFPANTNGTNQLSIGNVIYGTSMNGVAQGAGRIGINFNLPSSTLHVSGTIQMSSAIGTLCSTSTLGAIRYSSTTTSLAACLNPSGTPTWYALASTSTVVSATQP